MPVYNNYFPLFFIVSTHSIPFFQVAQEGRATSTSAPIPTPSAHLSKPLHPPPPLPRDRSDSSLYASTHFHRDGVEWAQLLSGDLGVFQISLPLFPSLLDHFFFTLFLICPSIRILAIRIDSGETRRCCHSGRCSLGCYTR